MNRPNAIIALAIAVTVNIDGWRLPNFSVDEIDTTNKKG